MTRVLAEAERNTKTAAADKRRKGDWYMEKSKVYFIRQATPENVVRLYKALGVELKGKVAVKVHSGEEGNQNYLRPEFMKPMVEYVKGTVVECNTAYGGKSPRRSGKSRCGRLPRRTPH